MSQDRIPVGSDVFGQALLDEHEVGGICEITERDDGYITARPIDRYFQPYSQWPELERYAIDRCGGRVLDVGAGAGRAALELQDRGLDVLCVDHSPAAIEVCRRRGVRHSFLGSVGDLPAQSTMFSSVLVLGGTLGFLGSPAAATQFLTTTAAFTAPGARLFGLGTDPYVSSDDAHQRYYERNLREGRLGGQLHLRLRHRATTTAWFDFWMATIDELEAVVASTPWTLESVQREGARYLVVLARQ
ncbi:class I SAM-dependent methyltransferase [Nocardia jejuensis]|uniref:class I SAM-dependent methyltransferase n=1 Tax=Nocardia jejuensis TaxID=328049 RepID=UPI000829D129|nr:class I SAM-dependent methyltransferase [Nocardia jejuensis]